MSSDKLSEKEKIKVMEKELGLVLAKQICQARTDKEWTQELICKGWFQPPNTYDCGSFVVN